MTSDVAPRDLYVWVWLPGATQPVVAGKLTDDGPYTYFTYGRSYLANPHRVPLYLPELPLTEGPQGPPDGMRAAGCIRDAAPDAWGRRVILARAGFRGDAADPDHLSLTTYLRESGSDRVGALDFQDSPVDYVPRESPASLEQMQRLAEDFLEGDSTKALSEVLIHGTSIGGARPKVVIHDEGAPDGPAEMIAKLSTSTDIYPVIKAEAAAMRLAEDVGLSVARTRLTTSLGRDVLLVDRFDRPGTRGSIAGKRGQRRMLVSALTILGLDSLAGRYASYPDLADQIRKRFVDPDRTLHELFSRIVFNICVSNTDDHARNHAAFWDGSQLELTPAYDISPQMRSGDTAFQALAIGRDGQRASRFKHCIDACEVYHLSRSEAADIVERQVSTIHERWNDVTDEARLTAQERKLLMGRLILNKAAFFDD